jgi:hypothetical protein
MFSQLALETAEKNHVEAGVFFDLKFVCPMTERPDRQMKAHVNFKSKPYPVST